jgi:very-short-patch-repair endonuclease
MLVVEVDGPYHDFRKRKDHLRDAMMRSMGLKIIRVRNEEVGERMEHVLTRIRGLVLSSQMTH